MPHSIQEVITVTTPKDDTLYLIAPANKVHSYNVQLKGIDIRPTPELKTEYSLQDGGPYVSKRFTKPAPDEINDRDCQPTFIGYYRLPHHVKDLYLFLSLNVPPSDNSSM